MQMETVRQNSSSSRLMIATGGGAVGGALLMYVGLWAAGSFSPAVQQPQQPVTGVAANGNGNEHAGTAHDGASTTSPAVSATPIDLAWLPPDAEVFVRWNVAETLNSPLVQSLADQAGLSELVAQFESETGQHPQDIESVCAAGRASDESRGLPLFGLSSIDGMTALGTVIVVRSKITIDEEKLTSAEREMEVGTHRGQTYYRQGDGSSADPAALFFPNDKTVVMGSESSVKGAIERGPKSKPRPELQFIDGGKQLVAAFVPRDRDVFAAALADAPPESKMPKELREAIENGLKGLAFTADLSNGVDIKLTADCTESTEAQKLARSLKAALTESRVLFDAQSKTLPEAAAEITTSLIDGVKTSSNENIAAVALTVPQALIVKIKELDPQSQALLTLAVMGMGPFAGGGAADPGLGGDAISALEGGTPQTFELPSQAPKEIEVSAIVRWNRGRSTDYEGNKIPRDFQLWVYVIGQQAVKAIGWGDVKFEAVTTNADEALEPKEQERYGRREKNSYQKIRRSRYGSEHPKHGVRAMILFPHPRKQLKSLAEVNGSLKLQVATGKKSTIIEKLPSFIGKRLVNRDLKDLGLTLTLTEKTDEFSDREQKSLILTVAEGNPDVIANAELVDANGEPLSYVNAYRRDHDPDAKVSFQISAGEKKKIPADLRIKLTLHVGLHEVAVPFVLEDIGVPPEPDDLGKPGLPVEGSPEGIKLASKLMWRDGPGYTYEGKLNPPALLVEINMTGPTAKKSLAWGFVTLSGAQGSGDVPLEMEQGQYSEEAEATRSFVRIVRDEYSAHQHPEGGVRGVLALQHPAKPISTIKNIQGSLKIRIAKETKEVILKSVKSLVGKDLTHEDFKKAGLEFSLTKVGKTVMRLTLIQGNSNLIGKVTAIDSEGDKLDDVGTNGNRDGQNTYFQLETYDDKFPAGMQLKIELHKDITILTVPYHFEELPIPDLPVP